MTDSREIELRRLRDENEALRNRIAELESMHGVVLGAGPPSPRARSSQEERYRRLFDSNIVGIIIANPSGNDFGNAIFEGAGVGLAIVQRIVRRHTSSKEDPDIQEAYALGANSYVVKPVAFDQFVEAMGNLGFYWLLVNQPPK